MLLSAIYGIRILSILNYIAVPILLFVCIYGLVVSLNNGGLAVEKITNQQAVCRL